MLLAVLLACPRHEAAPNVQLDSFDYAWSRVAETHYDPEMNGIDWTGVRAELRPAAEAAASNAELRPVLEDMLGRLGDSHYSVIPVEVGALRVDSHGELVINDGVLGFELRRLDGQAVVVRSEREEVAMGWILHSVGDTDVDAFLAQKAPGHSERELNFLLNGLLDGPRGQSTTLGLVGQEEALSVELDFQAPPGEVASLGNLPGFYVELREQLMVEDGVGYVAFNAFFPPIMEPWGQAVADFKEAGVDGMIVDLRGNPGGVSGMAVGMTGYLMSDRSQVLGVMTSRDSEFRFLVTPRLAAQRYEGPVAVLVDGMSASTAEIFAAGLQGNGRARVFGSTSAGMALPSTVERLPNGDLLQLVIANLVGPNGERIEGLGVVPDEPVPLTRASLLGGHDDVIEAALAWIATQGAE